MNHIDRERVDRFNRYWEDLYEEFPEARARAVEAMGQTVYRDLNSQIIARVSGTHYATAVQGWQELRLGSKGGYAAITHRSGNHVADATRQGRAAKAPVTAKRLTVWAERGRGVRKPAPGSRREWAKYTGSARLNERTGLRYIPGLMFYSWTKMKALDHALKAADRVLGRISDEVDY